jgi:hypothetical protein
MGAKEASQLPDQHNRTLTFRVKWIANSARPRKSQFGKYDSRRVTNWGTDTPPRRHLQTDFFFFTISFPQDNSPSAISLIHTSHIDDYLWTRDSFFLLELKIRLLRLFHSIHRYSPLQPIYFVFREDSRLTFSPQVSLFWNRWNKDLVIVCWRFGS